MTMNATKTLTNPTTTSTANAACTVASMHACAACVGTAAQQPQPAPTPARPLTANAMATLTLVGEGIDTAEEAAPGMRGKYLMVGTGGHCGTLCDVRAYPACATVRALLARGLIERVNQTVGQRGRFVCTAAGRAALAAPRLPAQRFMEGLRCWLKLTPAHTVKCRGVIMSVTPPKLRRDRANPVHWTLRVLWGNGHLGTVHGGQLLVIGDDVRG
jgi:hypothetical protein